MRRGPQGRTSPGPDRARAPRRCRPAREREEGVSSGWSRGRRRSAGRVRLHVSTRPSCQSCAGARRRCRRRRWTDLAESYRWCRRSRQPHRRIEARSTACTYARVMAKLAGRRCRVVPNARSRVPSTSVTVPLAPTKIACDEADADGSPGRRVRRRRARPAGRGRLKPARARNRRRRARRGRRSCAPSRPRR